MDVNFISTILKIFSKLDIKHLNAKARLELSNMLTMLLYRS